MKIELGSPVVAADGEQVGAVDRLVFNASSKEIRQLIIHQGTFLTHDRILDLPLVERIEADGTVRLTIPASKVDELPEFVEARFIIPQEDELRWLPHAWLGAQGTGAPLLFAPGPETGKGYDPHGGLMEAAPINPPEVEMESPLREDTIILDAGTNVVDRNGEKVGTVDDIIYDEAGAITGFVVKAGWIFHHDVHIPARWVESMTTDSVQLSVSAEEAEGSGASE